MLMNLLFGLSTMIACLLLQSLLIIVNAGGKIVGGSTATAVPGLAYGRAFLMERGEMIDLGSLGGPYAHAYAINNRGQVVGEASFPSLLTHAFLWQAGSMIDLGPPAEYSLALDLNNQGLIVGSAGLSDSRRAVLWIVASPDR